MVREWSDKVSKIHNWDIHIVYEPIPNVNRQSTYIDLAIIKMPSQSPLD